MIGKDAMAGQSRQQYMKPAGQADRFSELPLHPQSPLDDGGSLTEPKLETDKLKWIIEHQIMTPESRAAFGGTTSIMSFAVQHRGTSLRDAVADYHRRAEGNAVIDYGFHLVVADPTPAVLGQELPALIRRGHASLKVYMTYDAMRLTDRQILDVLAVAHEERAVVLVHAENHEIIGWLADRLEREGHTKPLQHATSRPLAVEREATHRAITLGEVADVPLVIVHVSGAEPADEIGRARACDANVHTETCPQYLFLTEDDLGLPDMQGAKAMCSPPPRDTASQKTIWQGIEDGLFDIFNSDHAPIASTKRESFMPGRTHRSERSPTASQASKRRFPCCSARAS